MNGPVNDLAQLWIWRLEAKVLATLWAVAVVAVCLIAAAIGGADAVAWVYGTSFVILGVFILWCLFRALMTAITGPDYAKLNAEGDAALKAASKAIGAGQHYEQ